MFNITRKEINWGGRPLIIETGKIARQADGAVLVTYGETQVLCTAVANRSARPGQDFFPLTVNYQEKTFAAGKIPGGFFKREGRPSEKETLTSRSDRSADPAVVPGRIPERNPSHMHCSGARSGKRPGHRRVDRLFRGADNLRCAFHGPHCRLPRWSH